MAFENVTIQVTKDSTAAETTWRQDCTVGSAMSFALSDTTGVNTFAWRLVGRPEGSGAGGGGPEPISLGTAQTANITIDEPGTYIVECAANAGAPNAQTLKAGCAYPEAILSPQGKLLRLLGPGESDEDISDPLVRQGWIKMLNRWLCTLAAGGGGGTDTFEVKANAEDGSPAFLDTKLSAGANVTLAPVVVGGVETIQISSTGGSGGGTQVCNTTSGIIPAATATTLVVTVDGGLTVNGMAVAGLASGTFLRFIFTNACVVERDF